MSTAAPEGKVLDFAGFASPDATSGFAGGGDPFSAPFGGGPVGAAPGSAEDPFAFIGSQSDVDNVEVLDLTSTDENARSKRLVLAPGTYNASIEDAQYVKSKSGKPMIKVVFKAFHPADPTKSVRVFYYLILTPDFLPRVKKFMLTLAPEVDLKTFNPIKVAGELIGRQARLKLKVGEFNGEHKNEIDDRKDGIQSAQTTTAWA